VTLWHFKSAKLPCYCCTEEEDAVSHGNDMEIEETHNSSVSESESESSEAELGELMA